MTCILVDDEANCLEMLSILIKKYCPILTILGEYDNPQKGIDAIYALKPDVVFLDVEMPALTGFDVLERCKLIPFQVIFTTAHNKYALKAIKYSAIDYILKPVNPEELTAAVQKVFNQKNALFQEQQREIQRGILLDYTQSAKPIKEKIALATSDGIVFLDIKNIVFCESEGNYTKVYCLDKSAELFTKPLKEFEELLSDSAFYRVHHSYLVNLKQVAKYIKSDGGELQMSNGKIIPISRPKKNEVLEALTNI
jgi:two-component system, LytTR family, response regulator